MEEQKENNSMPIERWREACKAASNAANYRRERGYTMTKDDAFVDGVQWADEHPTKDSYKKYLSNKVWHDVNEKPEREKLLFIIMKCDNCKDCRNKYKVGVYGCRGNNHPTWVINGYGCYSDSFILKWAYISDLLPDNYINKEKEA